MLDISTKSIAASRLRRPVHDDRVAFGVLLDDHGSLLISGFRFTLVLSGLAQVKRRSLLLHGLLFAQSQCLREIHERADRLPLIRRVHGRFQVGPFHRA